MKKIKISTALLLLVLFTMSMGFPYKSASEQSASGQSKSRYTYAGLMSCSVQQSEQLQRIKPTLKDCSKVEDTKGKMTCNLAGQSASILINLLKEKR